MRHETVYNHAMLMINFYCLHERSTYLCGKFEASFTLNFAGLYFSAQANIVATLDTSNRVFQCFADLIQYVNVERAGNGIASGVVGCCHHAVGAKRERLKVKTILDRLLTNSHKTIQDSNNIHKPIRRNGTHLSGRVVSYFVGLDNTNIVGESWLFPVDDYRNIP